MAGSTGFEPAISSVTGRRDNHFTTSPSSTYNSKISHLAQLRLQAFNILGLGGIITKELTGSATFSDPTTII